LFECGTIFALIGRTILNCPTWNERLQSADAGNADFLLVDHRAYAPDSLNINLRESPVLRLLAHRDNQALSLVKPYRLDGYSENIGRFTDGVGGLLIIWAYGENHIVTFQNLI